MSKLFSGPRDSEPETKTPQFSGEALQVAGMLKVKLLQQCIKILVNIVNAGIPLPAVGAHCVVFVWENWGFRLVKKVGSFNVKVGLSFLVEMFSLSSGL